MYTEVYAMTPQQKRRLLAAIAKMHAGISERNKVISEIYAEGVSLRDIAEVVEMSAMGIQKIVKKGIG